MTALEHARLKQRIRLALGAEPGVIIFNNPVGFDSDRSIRYGLGKGSCDLIGVVDGIFVGIEIKTGSGRPTKDQAAWIAAVRAVGAVAGVVRSVDDARELVREARERAGERDG